MKIYQNDRIRVTLTDEQSEQWKHCRADILSHAMLVLGNKSELKLLESETISEPDAETAAMEILTYEYLSEHCRYDLSETLMRMMGGHRMSEGMAADVSAARAYARNELINNTAEALEKGKKSIKLENEAEKKYRKSRANSTWDIEIIGDMPEQIGMCRFKNEETTNENQR